ncbi:MAG: nicotinate phosphoribosyltransferase [Isosphaeraceae bacterium]|nr:nicotinate phosphoribosyltransferase [Isosphaeraceae bacterium]
MHDSDRAAADLASRSAWPDPQALGTLTDLYQLTMMAGHAASGLDDSRATFELFVRKLPPGRAYLVFAGLEQAIADLLRMAISREQAEALRAWPIFANVDPRWFDRLPDLRFRGDLWAVPEGTVVYAGEPLVRVSGRLPEVQWVETYLLASLAYPTLVASKAARVVSAARGRSLLEFGTRRGHGPQASLICARSAYLAGFDATSNVEAALRFGIPCSGTMAHAWIQAHGDEERAFADFARVYPHPTLLVDTYDTLEGVRRAAAIEPAAGAIRLDSGDLGALARDAREILDAAGRESTKIVASGDLDERKIDRLLAEGAPIDVFGVGTELITSRDAPAISMVYKLVEQDGVGRIKLSPGKKTYPGAKQIFRRLDAAGRFAGDHVTHRDEVAEGEPLLRPFVAEGRLAGPLPTLEESRARCRAQLAALPDRLRELDAAADFPISYSDRLELEARALGVK